tara:strand:+ start:2304 stop:3485 length:1182 start_codon:yes stop_codon:yes gene_type:complete
MVKLLLIEDDQEKQSSINNYIKEVYGNIRYDIDFAETFGVAVSRIFENSYDAIIVDLLMPKRVGDEPVDISEALVDHLRDSKKNARATIIAISQHDDIASARRQEFNRLNAVLLPYSKPDEWRVGLKIFLEKVQSRPVTDFLIVCALEMERGAFRHVEHLGFYFGELVDFQGLNCRELRLGNLRGYCVLLPRMGLVDAAIETSRALALFSPKLVCMSGICAGFPQKTQLGQVIVSEICWEHQMGKWSDNKFETRLYQCPIDSSVQTVVRQVIEADPGLSAHSEGFESIEVPRKTLALLAPTVSGSAVVNSQKKIDEILTQHPKLCGLDMEVYAVHRAVELFGQGVRCFAAKTVVDLADGNKNDHLHREGAILSARFSVQVIERVLSPDAVNAP